MESMAAARPRRQEHVVAVPVAAQGHLNPLMRFCKQLARRGFVVTFVTVGPIHRRLEAVKHDAYGASEAEAAEGEALTQKKTETEIGEEGAGEKGKVSAQKMATVTKNSREGVDDEEDAGSAPQSSDGIRFACIPFHGFDLANDFRVSLQTFFEAQNGIASQLEALIVRLNRHGPPVTCLISDIGLTIPTQKVADKLAIPRIAMYTSAASFQLLVSYVAQGKRTSVDQSLSALNGCKTEVFSDQDTLPGLPSLLNADLPNFTHMVDDNHFMWKHIVQTTQESESRSHAMVINSFEELEGPAFKALSEGFRLPVYGVGPLVEPLDRETSLWEEEEGCIAWLEQQPPLSVLYISFGSVAILSQPQMNEIMAALASTQQRFLWTIRRDLAEGAASGSAISSFLAMESESKGRGYVVGWAPQLKVLSHPSVGGFLSHCGWNSVIEAIAHGVPMLCWPYSADQTLNAMYVVRERQIGLLLAYGPGLVQKAEIESAITALMAGAEGRTVRENISHFKELAHRSLLPGGSSNNNLEALIKSLHDPKPSR